MRWLAGIAWTAIGIVACSERPSVSIDLAAMGTGLLDGRRVSVGAQDAAGLRVPAGSSLEVALRLPAAPRLRLVPASETSPAEIAIEVEAEDGSERALALAERRTADGVEWQARLDGLDDLAARLRFRNRSRHELAVARARIDGRGWIRPALVSARAPGDRPLNVILYVADTLRADHLGLYGYPLPTSPKLDKLARRAAVFRWAYAPGANTMTSVPALLASRRPWEMGGRMSPEGPGRRTLAEAFREAGYDTAGFQANFLAMGPLGFDRGFDSYRVLKRKVAGDWQYWRASQVHDAALSWVRAREERPFFLYVQVMDAHVPHDVHPTVRGKVHPPSAEAAAPYPEDRDEPAGSLAGKLWRLREASDPRLYDEDVRYATHEFARFMRALRRLGRLEDTVVLLTSDHGEPLGEHQHVLHGTALYEEQIHVPLVVWAPGIVPGWREEIVGLIDVAPTLLDLAGLAAPDSFLGRSLAREQILDAPASAIGERLPAARRQPPVGTYVREGPWKLITEPSGIELFHLPDDPDETTNLADGHPVLRDHLVTRATAHIPYDRADEIAPTPFDDGLPASVKRELHDALRALGYVE